MRKDLAVGLGLTLGLPAILWLSWPVHEDAPVGLPGPRTADATNSARGPVCPSDIPSSESSALKSIDAPSKAMPRELASRHTDSGNDSAKPPPNTTCQSALRVMRHLSKSRGVEVPEISHTRMPQEGWRQLGEAYVHYMEKHDQIRLQRLTIADTLKEAKLARGDCETLILPIGATAAELQRLNNEWSKAGHPTSPHQDLIMIARGNERTVVRFDESEHAALPGLWETSERNDQTYVAVVHALLTRWRNVR